MSRGDASSETSLALGPLVPETTTTAYYRPLATILLRISTRFTNLFTTTTTTTTEFRVVTVVNDKYCRRFNIITIIVMRPVSLLLIYFPPSLSVRLYCYFYRCGPIYYIYININMYISGDRSRATQTQL